MYNIIVPLDGSTLAEQALEMALVLARVLLGEIRLVRVLEPLGRSGPGDAGRAAAEAYLARVAARLPEDVRVNRHVLTGTPVDALHTFAATAPGAMIVMSTHGRGAMGRLVFGSVTEKVLRGTSVPVVVVRDALPGPDSRLRFVLVPLDGSAVSEAALPMGMELARRSGATLCLVRVVDPYPPSQYSPLGSGTLLVDDDLISELGQQVRDDARAYLDGIGKRLRDEGVRVVWEVRLGRPADEIVRAAETTGADLVVMSTHGRSGIRRWAFGSVTEEVMRSGVTSVLVIPPAVRGERVRPESSIAPPER